MIPFAPIIGVLGKVPVWAWLLGAALAWGGYHRLQAIGAKADFKEAQVQAQAAHDKQIAADATESARRAKTIMEAADAANIQAEQARAAAVRERDSRKRVQLDVAALQADARRRDSETPGGCAATEAAGAVLADLLGRAEERAGILAEYADGAWIAGTACERSYDALNSGEVK